jgi:crotonobetainyl-CoA:carnitine CoA-transferase CaiB-like acyl-CoA transferase
MTKRDFANRDISNAATLAGANAGAQATDSQGTDAPDPDVARPGPLAGIRVLDLGTVYAAPITAMLLGDYGADVIKVEHPRGDPARTHGLSKDGHGLWWKVIARNKRTITLNLSTPQGQELLRRLVGAADVLVENFRPGVMEDWGLGPKQLQEINPGLVMLRVTGFGQSGPYAKRRAFGTLAEAMSGMAHQTGQADGPPTLPPFGLADGVSGVSGALAVLLALYHRDTSGGGGQVIDLALLEPLLGILGPGPSVYDQLGIIAGRHRNRSPSNAPRNAYLTADNRWVAISASATSIAERVMRLVGRPDIAEKPWFCSAEERVQRAELIDRPVSQWIGAHSFTEVVDAFEAAGAALAPVYDVEQLMQDPHVLARDVVTTIEDEDLGPLKMQNLFFRMSCSPGSIRHGGRRLGQDTAEVLAELAGLHADELDALRRRGVI